VKRGPVAAIVLAATFVLSHWILQTVVASRGVADALLTGGGDSPMTEIALVGLLLLTRFAAFFLAPAMLAWLAGSRIATARAGENTKPIEAAGRSPS
jgi:hypothetical protein